MSQLTPEDFQVWGKQKSSAKFDKAAGSSGPIGGYDPNKKTEAQAKPKSSTTNEAEEAPVVVRKQDDSCYAKVRLKSIELVAGEAGVFEFNKKCKAKGAVEILQESATKRATVTLVCRYKGTEYEIEKKDAAISGDAIEIELSLFYADPFYDDYAKDKSITCEYFAKLSHGQTTTVLSSTPLTMPQQKKTVVLKKGMYDDNVNKEKSGNDYIAGSDIKTLQTNLNTMNFACGTPDGGFGPKTEAAVKLFQKYAKESKRLKKSASAYETVAAVLQGEIDGVVGDKTVAEIREWIDKKYVKPVLPIRQGDYDDEGVKKGKGAKGGDDHRKGTDIITAQQDLQKVGAYDGAVDGWFWDKMKSAVELFQQYAVKGQFLIDGKLTDIGEKLAGHHMGTLDAPTQEFVKKVVVKGGKVGEGGNLTDSVGQGGANKPVDVKKVKMKLKELGYPVKDESEMISTEDIKAIKFFQVFSKAIPNGLVTVDGRIDKGGKAEAALFGKNTKPYDPPKKVSVKPLAPGIEKRKNDAINGTDEDLKKIWQGIIDVWEEVSPYLPEGTRMESGYRSTEGQRSQLYSKHTTFKAQISKKFGLETWQKYNEMQGTKMTAAEISSSDAEMHRQICEAVSSREVALPGKSMHEHGKAIDTQVSDASMRIRCLLWYSVQFDGTIKNITMETNACGHFEFD